MPKARFLRFDGRPCIQNLPGAIEDEGEGNDGGDQLSEHEGGGRVAPPVVEDAGPLPGHGFPDPSLVPVVAALDGAPGWELKLGRFVERWVGRSEELLRSRAAALNGALLIVAAVVMASGIDAMFSILEQAAGR